MSDQFHRPTLTFPSGAYNATQVRLYGITGEVAISIPQQATRIQSMNVTQEAPLFANPDPIALSALTNLIGKGDSTAHNLDLLNGNITVPVIPGIGEIPVRVSSSFAVNVRGLGTSVVMTIFDTKVKDIKSVPLSCGLMLGYAYEGHTYDLPKPKLMFVPVSPLASIPPDDSGYDRKVGKTATYKDPTGYCVWVVDKLDECVEIETSQGFIEQLVLDANMPGRRSPTMYAAKMMGGRGGMRDG